MAGRLTVRRVRAVKTAGRYGDGGTLFLYVAPGGSKSWVQRLTINGRRVDRGLGGYPFVLLSEARDLAFDNRRKARRGIDPFTEARRAPVPTFAEAAAQTLEAHKTEWAASTRRVWLGPLAKHAFPSIGDLPVDGLTRQHVIDLLRPMVAEAQPTARKLYKAIRTVLRWAQGAGHVEHNVAADGGITAALPALRHQQTTHHKALPHEQMPAAYSQIADSGASASAKACARFIVLTGVRSAEARGAEWSEIDGDAREWRIPAGRMKAKRPHVVPLTDAALALVESMRGISETFVFPSARTGRPLSNRGLAAATKHIDATMHGSRSSFSTWAHNTTQHDADTIEACLAHTVGNAVARGYNRGDRLDKRRTVMNDWARYLAA